MLTKKDNLKNGKNSKSPASNQNESSLNSQALAKAPNQLPATQSNPNPSGSPEKKGGAKTRITVRYDVGFPNQLYIRGKGGNLSWDKGIAFKNTKPDEWVWETDTSFTQCEFKVLINDRIYENGENHVLNHGASLLYSPHFN